MAHVRAVADRGAQADLFDAAPAWPAGLAYVPDFLSAGEEAALLDHVRALPLEEARYKGYVARRRTLSYGGTYDFDVNVLRPAPPFPDFLAPLRARVAAHLGLARESFAHALVTEYRPGTPLGWHRDVPDFETVVGVSLAGRGRLRFRRYPHTPRAKGGFELALAPRSLYVMAGEVRWGWQHSVPPAEVLRYSITLRTAAARRVARSTERDVR